MTFLFSSSKTPISDELLSAYSDAEVTSAEKQRVEQALRTQPELRQRLAELRLTVDLLAQMEPVALPRAFVLSEAQVQASGPRIFPSPHWWGLLLPRLMPLATAAVAVALVVVLGIDMTAVDTAPQPQLAAMPVAAEPEMLQAEEESAPQAVAPPEPVRMKETAVEKQVETTVEVEKEVAADEVETPTALAAPTAELQAQTLAEAEAISSTVEAQTVAAAPAVEKAIAPAASETEQPTSSPANDLTRVEWLLGGLLMLMVLLSAWVRRRYQVG